MATRDATGMSGILITFLIHSNTQKVYKTDLIKNCNHERLILRNTRNYELCSTFHVHQMYSGYITTRCGWPCKVSLCFTPSQPVQFYQGETLQNIFYLQSPERTNVCTHYSCFIQKLLSIKTKPTNLHSKRPQQLLLCPNLWQLKTLKLTSQTYPNSTPTLPQQWGWGPEVQTSAHWH